MIKRRKLVYKMMILSTLLFSSCNLIVKTPDAIAKQVVATFGNNTITRGQLDNSYEFAEMKASMQYMGQQLDPEVDIETYTQYKAYALDDLVEKDLVIAQAEKENIQIDQAKLDEAVKSATEEFKKNFQDADGNFNQTQYDEYLKSVGITEEVQNENTIKQEKVELIWEQFLKNVTPPTDDEVKADYDNNKATYEKDYNKLDTAHILISTQEDSKRTEEEALKRAEEVKAKLDAGGDFAALAKEYSDDTSNKDKGGEISEQTFGSLDEGYVNGAKVLQVGQISGPVKSSFGYHIIKLNSISFDGDSFDKVKQAISDKLLDSKKDEEKKTLLEKFKKDFNLVTDK